MGENNKVPLGQFYRSMNPSQAPSLQFVNHFGYVSLFPFFVRILDPKSPQLKKILEDLLNPEELRSEFGLRSLSKKSSLYQKYNTEHDGPYWRGAVWININYMTLQALAHYKEKVGPYQELAGLLYSELRSEIVENLYKVYEETGFVWEQYDDMTGKGKGCHPFNGWSSLVVLIMAESF